MKLWDHNSPIKWVYDDYPSTIEEMQDNPEFKFFLDTNIVLFDDGRDKVYSYTTLDELKARYNVRTENPNNALQQIRMSMSHHVPTNSELSRLNKNNEASIKDNDDRISTLASTVVNQSTRINAQNSQVSRAVENSEKAVRQVDYLTVSSESNSLAIEELIPLSLDSSLASIANTGALEEVIPQVLDHTEFSDTLAEAVEEIITKICEDEVQVEELMDRIRSINDSVTEIKSKLDNLNERLDALEFDR